MNFRGDSIRVMHPLFQVEDDGSTPISPLQLNVSECDISTAIALNELWHSRLPNVVKSNIQRTRNNVCFAAYFDNKYYASAIWTDPIARNLNGKLMLELRRLAIANDAPKNTASRVLKLMRLLIKTKFPFIETLISYQDTDVHTGTIYKAAGWVNTNRSKVSKTGWNSRDRNKMQATGDKIRWEYSMKKRGRR